MCLLFIRFAAQYRGEADPIGFRGSDTCQVGCRCQYVIQGAEVVIFSCLDLVLPIDEEGNSHTTFMGGGELPFRPWTFVFEQRIILM